MIRTVRVAAASVLAIATFAFPLALDQCAAACDAHRRADATAEPACHHHTAPVTRIDERLLQPGPIYRKARELYWAFAHRRC